MHACLCVCVCVVCVSVCACSHCVCVIVGGCLAVSILIGNLSAMGHHKVGQ